MKQLNKILFAVTLLLSFASHAQDKNNPWAISFGANAVDTRTSASDRPGNFGDQFSKFFKVSESWNILPSISYLNVSRYVGDDFSFGVSGTINKIDKYANWAGPGHTDIEITNPGDLMYYGVDGVVKYSFMNLIKSKVIDPSLHVGGGYTFFGDTSFGTINGGAGITFWFNEFTGISAASTYKHNFGERNFEGTDLPDSPIHFQHTLGLTFKFGGKDSDNDGIYDKFDDCPNEAGLKAFKGCPDTDGDGIMDKDDECPEVAGLAPLNGCPDTDGDTVADKDDDCPNVAGLVALKGCPDSDGDSIKDGNDKCPTVKGPKENAGCPWPDTDGDSVIDKDDKCPTEKGTVGNNGCPEVTSEELDDLKVQSRSVYFLSGKTVIVPKVSANLDKMATILKSNPAAKFSIEGHTDSDGSDESNQILSEKRADIIKTALIERGVNAENLTTKGFGETTPIAPNTTAKGKSENRRTEVKLKK